MLQGPRGKVIIGLLAFSLLLFVGFFFTKVDLNEPKVDQLKLQKEQQLRDQALREQRAQREKELRELDGREEKEKAQLREQREKKEEREHKDKKELRVQRERSEATEESFKKEQRAIREQKEESEAKEKREMRERRAALSSVASTKPTVAVAGETLSPLEKRASTFNDIFHGGVWGSKESRSGPGSELSQTGNIRGFLAKVFVKYNISSMLDAPCGDFNWQPHVEGILNLKYTGADIVPSAIDHNKNKTKSDPEKFKNFSFMVLDVVGTPITERYDLIHCRDALQHMPLSDAKSAIDNFKSSGSTYLMTNFHRDSEMNREIQPGDFYPINVMKHPFNFPEPLEFIHEHPAIVGSIHGQKMMGIWKLKDLPSYKK